MPSPTFVAKFADGVVTRMTCHCEAGKDDENVQRGIKLSLAAYESRTKQFPPLIIEGRFVEPFSNTVLREYPIDELERHQHPMLNAA
jgi:hypothetical protein